MKMKVIANNPAEVMGSTYEMRLKCISGGGSLKNIRQY